MDRWNDHIRAACRKGDEAYRKAWLAAGHTDPSAPDPATVAEEDAVAEPPTIESEEQEPPPPLRRRWLMARIAREVASKHNISVEDLKGPSRSKCIVRARGEAMRRLDEELHLPANHIGAFLRKDYSTVLHHLGRLSRRRAQVTHET